LPYFREEDLGNRLGQILKDIYIPDHVLSQLEKSPLTDRGREATLEQEQEQRLQQRLASVRNRIDHGYLDKLDGKITEEMWNRKSPEWQAEEQQIQMAICALADIKPERMLDAVRILELAIRLIFCTLSSPQPKRRNCSIWCFRTARLMSQVFIPHTESPSM